MKDRKLLELAAKAAGYKYSDLRLPGESGLVLLGQTYWDPIDDDGDALRLAVKLNITIQFPWDHKGKLMQETRCWNDSDDFAIEEHKDDPYAATRRAIVRAAAEIGRSM